MAITIEEFQKKIDSAVEEALESDLYVIEIMSALEAAKTTLLIQLYEKAKEKGVI